MFKSLKKKLKGALSKFSKDVEEEAKVEEVEETIEEPEVEAEEPGVEVKEGKPKKKEKPKEKEKPKKKEKKKPEEKKQQAVGRGKLGKEAVKPPEEAKPKAEPKGKQGLLKKIKKKVTTVELSEEKFEELFWELEVALMENNVALEVVEKIKEDLRSELAGERHGRGGVEEIITNSLQKSIEELFEVEGEDLVGMAKQADKPFVVAFIGVNGSGKTTSMAKVAKKMMDDGLSVVFAAADTFRAASIEQLGEHAEKLGVKMIRHEYESDPAAVAFDAISHAKAKGVDVVLIDTAGRLHSNKNLMRELKKLVEVNKPDLKVFVGESTTGNDCVEQAKQFDEAVGIDSIILTKADVDDKGGAAISISYMTGKPIIYIGTGQKYEDLQRFDKKVVVESLF